MSAGAAPRNGSPAACCAGPSWRDPALRAVAGPTLRPGGFALTERAVALAGLLPGWPVLDVGAGSGASVARLRSRHGARAVGLDPDPGQLGAPVQPGLPLMRAAAGALPVRTGSQRLVLCECVLSLVPDPAAALGEFARVLAPGGVLALADLCLPPGAPRAGGAGAGPEAEAHAAPSCAAGARTVAEIAALVRAAGLDPFAVEDHGALARELAARLAFGGAAPGCAARRGYFLLLARKPGGPA
ncbi:DVU_1556 family methyltransferase [Desulfocurvus vexinensis]|uniref:DVU_1556 family methyltransferase n=1 Tax=Desulfocurvus vexinensis TaxID=399548 RepID=UPI0004B1B63C|nr:class I SAM-dependent methyltransferase [Desulfocurvus vexinensis]